MLMLCDQDTLNRYVSQRIQKILCLPVLMSYLGKNTGVMLHGKV